MRRQGSGVLQSLFSALLTPNAALSQQQCLQFSTKPHAFVFDIDGVLIRGKAVLEPAKRALSRLYSGDGQQPKHPVCFLTNGGGVLEATKAAQLSRWLGVQVSADQVVLSHTPFKELVPQLRDKPVLVAGRHDVEKVAKSYGFRKTVTTSQLAATFPSAVPFLSDPSNWYLDMQLATEIITSGGVIGRREPAVGQPPVKVYFSNPDKIFAGDHPTPRFGQGAFALALRAVLTQVAEHTPQHWKVFGKPNPEPYHLAAKVLAQQAEQLGLEAAGGSQNPFGSIYMVGDNPASDIAGARSAGEPWRSILVRTGVFNGPEANSRQHPADIVVEDVEQAVAAGLHRSRADKWHSFR